MKTGENILRKFNREKGGNKNIYNIIEEIRYSYFFCRFIVLWNGITAVKACLSKGDKLGLESDFWSSGVALSQQVELCTVV